MTTPTSPAPRRKRVAAGPKRPRYLSDRDLDRMMIMFVALMGEVSALRDRLDTHEALADAGRPSRTDEVEAFVASAPRVSRRDEIRMATVRRVYRVLMEEVEAGKPGDLERLGVENENED